MDRPLAVRIVVGLAALALVAPARAQDSIPGTRRVALAEVVERAAAGSPEVRLAAAEVAAARARVVTAGARSAPTLALDREQLGGGDEDGYHETILSLSQPIDLSGARGARRGAAQAGVLAADSRAHAARASVRAAATRAYLRAAALEARLARLAGTRAAYLDAVRSAEARLREGDISEYEVQRLRTEVARYDAALLDDRLALAEAGRTLARLAGEPPGAVLLPAEPIGAIARAPGVPLDRVVLLARGQAAVRAAEAEVAAARAELESRRRAARPSPTLTLGAKEQAGGARGVVAGVSIPLPLAHRGRGPVQEAEALLRRAELVRDLALRDAEAGARAAWERHAALGERFAARERLGIQSESLLRAARVAYAEGEMTLVALLDAVEAHRAAAESADTLIADLLTSAADLEAAAGGYDR